ncbi:hypothetical protein [Kordiimonas sp. SCSIO 12610]|uniref:hypothetical protein n=1 Tax=Kordiimonas sp. SCSIO 12610 TaxID=2829597 RepID=UPI00210B5876|nr:hypothetical protein [Kordiimonas sp. SCSIO 12610]UTW56175.1 hypothetical protein KFF44_04565 [Kordiimonas sp. SCSIO 12610]
MSSFSRGILTGSIVTAGVALTLYLVMTNTSAKPETSGASSQEISEVMSNQVWEMGAPYLAGLDDTYSAYDYNPYADGKSEIPFLHIMEAMPRLNIFYSDIKDYCLWYEGSSNDTETEFYGTLRVHYTLRDDMIDNLKSYYDAYNAMAYRPQSLLLVNERGDIVFPAKPYGAPEEPDSPGTEVITPAPGPILVADYNPPHVTLTFDRMSFGNGLDIKSTLENLYKRPYVKREPWDKPDALQYKACDGLISDISDTTTFKKLIENWENYYFVR